MDGILPRRLPRVAGSEFLVRLLFGDPDLERILANHVEFIAPLSIPADHFAARSRLMPQNGPPPSPLSRPRSAAPPADHLESVYIGHWT
jgi:hypothetical protein